MTRLDVVAYDPGGTYHGGPAALRALPKAVNRLISVLEVSDAGPLDGQNQKLHFNPKPAGVTLIACLFAEWSDPKSGKQLLSLAAVTDEPPAEVAAAGHDRMVIRLTRENVDRWLTPQGRSDEELQAILSERQPAYYEHRVAA